MIARILRTGEVGILSADRPAPPPYGSRLATVRIGLHRPIPKPFEYIIFSFSHKRAAKTRKFREIAFPCIGLVKVYDSVSVDGIDTIDLDKPFGITVVLPGRDLDPARSKHFIIK